MTQPADNAERAILRNILLDQADLQPCTWILAVPGVEALLLRHFAERIAEYQTWEEAEDGNPYDHDSSPNGCANDCPACAWETEHSGSTE